MKTMQLQTIRVNGTARAVSRLCLGTEIFGLDNYEWVRGMLDRFREAGGTTVDTAYTYNKGEAEKAIGRYLEERGRDALVVLTKGAHHRPEGSRVNPEAIASDLAGSLERLRTDHVELYALHRDDPNMPVGPIMEALNEHLEAGRVRAIGASNWSLQRLREADAYAKANGLTGFAFNSPNLSLAKPNEPYWPNCLSADEAMLAWHQATGLPLFSWSPMARGFFSGRYSPDNREDADMVRVYYNEANWQRYDRARQLAAEKGCTAVQISLAYVLNRPFPVCASIGARSAEELESCLGAARLNLTEEECRWLESGGRAGSR